jgi:hypothetical protein
LAAYRTTVVSAVAAAIFDTNLRPYLSAIESTNQYSYMSAYESADINANSTAIFNTVSATNFAAIRTTDQSAYCNAVDAAHRTTDNSTYNATVQSAKYSAIWQTQFPTITATHVSTNLSPVFRSHFTAEFSPNDAAIRTAHKATDGAANSLSN